MERMAAGRARMTEKRPPDTAHPNEVIGEGSKLSAEESQSQCLSLIIRKRPGICGSVLCAFRMAPVPRRLILPSAGCNDDHSKLLPGNRPPGICFRTRPTGNTQQEDTSGHQHRHRRRLDTFYPHGSHLSRRFQGLHIFTLLYPIGPRLSRREQKSDGGNR